MANITLQHANTTSPISEADWEGTGAHAFGGLTALSAMVVNAAGQMQSRTMANSTLLGQIGGVMSAITVGANGGFNGTVLDFSGTQGPAGPVGLPMIWTTASGGPPGSIEFPGATQVALYPATRDGDNISALMKTLPGRCRIVIQGQNGNDHNVTAEATGGFAFSGASLIACTTILLGSKDSFDASELVTLYLLPTMPVVDGNTTTTFTGLLLGDGTVSNCTLLGTTGQIDISNGTPTAGQMPTFSLPNPLVVPGSMQASNITTLDTQVATLQSNETIANGLIASNASNITTLQTAVLALQNVLASRATATIDATTISTSTFNFGANGTLDSVT